MTDISPVRQALPDVPDVRDEVTRITYRYLRWLMILLPGVLLVVTISTAIQQRELQPSISAYYGGPVRDVFVGVLIATAACMVAYQGSSLLEDYTLNGAGFYAVFVALVPSNLDETLRALRANQTTDGVGDYIWFLRAALTTVLGLCLFLLVGGEANKKRLTELVQSGKWRRFFVKVTGAILLLFLLLAMWQLWIPDPKDVTMDGIPISSLRLRIHDLAAILLIAGLAVAVACHAWPREVAARESETDVRGRRTYKALFFAMLAGPVIALIVNAFFSGHVVIFLEWYEIALFGVFWHADTRHIGKRLADGAATRSQVRV
jgi:hypothetical protein